MLAIIISRTIASEKVGIDREIGIARSDDASRLYRLISSDRIASRSWKFTEISIVAR